MHKLWAEVNQPVWEKCWDGEPIQSLHARLNQSAGLIVSQNEQIMENVYNSTFTNSSTFQSQCPSTNKEQNTRPHPIWPQCVQGLWNNCRRPWEITSVSWWLFSTFDSRLLSWASWPVVISTHFHAMVTLSGCSPYVWSTKYCEHKAVPCNRESVKPQSAIEQSQCQEKKSKL